MSLIPWRIILVACLPAPCCFPPMLPKKRHDKGPKILALRLWLAGIFLPLATACGKYGILASKEREPGLFFTACLNILFYRVLFFEWFSGSRFYLSCI